MAASKGDYVPDKEGAEVNVDHLLLRARHEYLLEQLSYLATFLEKAGYALEAKSKGKEYPEAAGIGSGALSGAYAFVRSMRSGAPSAENLEPKYVEDSDGG